MLDWISLDKALDLAFSLASASSEAVLRKVQSSLTGVKLEVIVAGVGGSLTFILTLIVFSFRRPRNEVLQAWPSQEPRLTKIPEPPSHVTIISRIFEAPPHVCEERLELTDQLNEQLQRSFGEASSEPSRGDIVRGKQHNSWHLWRAVYSPVMKVAGNFLISSTTLLAALMDSAVSHVQAQVSSLSRARTISRSSCTCDWQRVAREGWMDDVLSWAGRYPWQCKHCLTCSYFRRRR